MLYLPINGAEMNQDLITYEPNTGCHLWTGWVNKQGYGQVFRRINGKGKTLLAHRVAYAEAHGGIPEGAQINHTCDTPLCVNPSHMYAGTQADNIRDMIARGRKVQTSGETHGSTKLDWDKVRSIRKSLDTCTALARQYGVSKNQISCIRSGRYWRE
jgi:hypothetical protein